MMDSRFPTYCYRVDAADRLAWVDSAWLDFANENGAAELTSAFILGRRLWGFFADNSTCELYQHIHRRIRITQQSFVLRLRCDSPTLKRHIQLSISPEDSGWLHYRSTILRVEPQNRLLLLDASTARSKNRLTMCSCCKKVCVEPTGWVEVEEVAAQLHLFESEPTPRLVYSVCPSCTIAAPIVTTSEN